MPAAEPHMLFAQARNPGARCLPPAGAPTGPCWCWLLTGRSESSLEHHIEWKLLLLVSAEANRATPSLFGDIERFHGFHRLLG